MLFNIKIGLSSLLILLCFISFVNAYSITKELKIGDSVELSGRNVTLIALDAKEDKVLICINGEKNIIPQHGKTIKGVLIEPKTVTSYLAEIRLKTEEKGNCGIECSNEACFGRITEPIKEQITQITTTTTTSKEKESIIEKEPIPTGQVVKEGSKISIFPLIFLGSILIVGFLVTFKKK